MSRGREGVIRDPSNAIAAAKCWLSRWRSIALIGIKSESIHPGECGWCEYEPDFLIDAVREFGSWSGSTGEGVPLRPEVEAFLTLPYEEQAVQVRRAQGYE